VTSSKLRLAAAALVTALLASACGASAAQPIPSPSTAVSPSPTEAQASTLEPTPVETDTPAPDTSAPAVTTTGLWSFNLFDSAGVRRQNPDDTACTAAAVVMALNMSDSAPAWTPSTTYEMQEAVLAYERAHMRAPLSSPGSDPQGMVAALNDLGFGQKVYADQGFSSVNDAAKAIVKAIARTHKPAVIFIMLGGHVQVVTGYSAKGQDPAVSDSFTVSGFYVTDPMIGSVTVVYLGSPTVAQTVNPDTYVTLSEWKTGSESVRFTQYWQSDGGINRAWYNKFVAVLATS
jgi:hypothetical protein